MPTKYFLLLQQEWPTWSQLVLFIFFIIFVYTSTRSIRIPINAGTGSNIFSTHFLFTSRYRIGVCWSCKRRADWLISLSNVARLHFWDTVYSIQYARGFVVRLFYLGTYYQFLSIRVFHVCISFGFTSRALGHRFSHADCTQCLSFRTTTSQIRFIFIKTWT